MIIGFLLTISTSIPCMGIKSYSYSEIKNYKNKILEPPKTNIPPGEYKFENATIDVVGTFPDSKPNLKIEGLPLIKSSLMKLFITGNFGKILTIFFPLIIPLRYDTYTLTLEFPKDIPMNNNTAFYVIVNNLSINGTSFNITNKRNTVTVNYKYISNENTRSFFAIVTYRKTMFFDYIAINCESVTINVPE